MKINNLFLILVLIIFSNKVQALENCNWSNQKGIPCVTISKTPNTSSYNTQGVAKQVFTKKQIIDSGATSALDLLKKVPGLDYYQTGGNGQQAAVFMRGSESNHTLILLNGIAINDQSVTNGMAEFGQDFVQTIQQIEVYKGSNGAHFGPDAIGGAINFVTDIDYTNSYAVSGFSLKNNSVDYNVTQITNGGWHLNFKGAANQNETNSAIAEGHEYDGTKNYQFNLNSIKWLSDSLKLKSTFYYRDTKSDYDSSAAQEESVTADNKMYTMQTGIERKTSNSFDNLILHYHNYDRKYYVLGKKDKYYSETITLKGERDYTLNNKLSYGFGGEYKYDWANFETQTYTSQSKGHVSNLGTFANVGYKFNKNQVLSIYGRNDLHKITDENQTYKINFTQFFNKFKLGATHSTGLKNPGLYEFYGSSNWHTGSESVDPSKSRTNELYAEYRHSDKISFNSTAYRTTISNRISGSTNLTGDTNQEGLESELSFSGNDQSLVIVSHFAKSRTVTKGPNSRRPDLSYGFDYNKIFNFTEYGDVKFNLSHRYIGDHIDWTGSKNEFVKSVDLVEMSIQKNLYGNLFSINFTNLLNERYEKPATYSQDGRAVNISWRKNY